MTGAQSEPHRLLTDHTGAVVISNLPRDCVACAAMCRLANELTTECGEKGRRRRGRASNGQYQAFLCSADPDHLKSSSTFKRELAFLLDACRYVEEAKQDITKNETAKTNRFFHNITTHNAHEMQDLYSLISQDALASVHGYQAQTGIVQSRLTGNMGLAAQLFLRVLKYQSSVKSEISVYRKLYDPKPVLNPSNHQIHKVIKNVVSLFFQELADNNIRISIESTDVTLRIDYESVQVALHHLLDNACKYSAPNQEIKVTFTSSAKRFCILFDMTSFLIGVNEASRLFEEGFSGSIPTKCEKAGRGLGMGLIRDLLKLNGGELSVVPGTRMESLLHGRFGAIYARNSFIVSFPLTAVVRDR